ncbi:MAG: helix-turn-helix domain-containing protein [Rhodobacteraceae bacterium]|nr:helix-turn-helix domain-containing protein [Paracoccaceae bacterium]
MPIHRVLDIVRLVAQSEAPLNATDIAGLINVPRATVYRLIATLEKEEVLQRSSDQSGVEISNNFLRTMISGASNHQIVAGFEETLSCAANNWGATAFLGRLNGPSIEIAHAVLPCNSKLGFVHPGNNIRAGHACSASKAILASLPKGKVARVLGNDLTAFTDKTITDFDALNQELERTKARGYAICDEEIANGITSVSAPVVVGRAGVVCSIGIVSFSHRMHSMGLEDIGEYIRAKAKSAVLNASQNLFEFGAA